MLQTVGIKIGIVLQINALAELITLSYARLECHHTDSFSKTCSKNNRQNNFKWNCIVFNIQSSENAKTLPEVITVHEIMTEEGKHWGISALCLEPEGVLAVCLDEFSSHGVFNLDGLPPVPEFGIKLNGKTAIYQQPW